MSSPSDLLQRLEALERYNRRLSLENAALKALGVTVVIVIVSLLVLGHQQPGQADDKTEKKEQKEKVIEAEQFLLRDKDNRIRAAIHVGANGPKYDLYDEKGTLRATLALGTNSDPLLVFFSADKKELVSLGILGEERFLTLRDHGETRRAILANKGEVSFLSLYDAKGQVRTLLGAAPAEQGLIVKDEKGKPRLSLQLEKDQPAFKILDAADKVLFQKP